MKVALIAAPYPLEEAPSVPLGLCYAAAAFETAKAEVRIFDYIVRKYYPEKLLEELSHFQPDVIGINSVTLNFSIAASILESAKQGFPSAVTIMGGPHVSFDYENTLNRYPGVDLIVIGEAEQTIAELMPVIRNPESWPQINGLAFRQDDCIVVTPQRELIDDLDRLPLPARHLLPMSRYLALGFPISIITSRGCPNRCIFCQGRRMVGSRIRNRSASHILDEIEILLSYGFERINVSDDFFTSNVRRVKQICEEIKKRHLSFNWTVFARADSVNKELLTIMREAGCDTIFFGIESGNQQMLDRVKKGLKLDRIRKAVADCKAVGMTVFGSFIVGLPGETWDTMMDSHFFAEELDIVYGYHYLAPFPGTEVKENIDQYDLKLLSLDWSDFDANHPIVETSGLAPREIEHFVEDYYLQKTREAESTSEKAYQEGKLSPSEQLLYLGKKKLDIVFTLLAEDIIETTVPIAFSGTDALPADLLSGIIAERINRPLEFVQISIRHLVDRGYLKQKTRKDHFVWAWA